MDGSTVKFRGTNTSFFSGHGMRGTSYDRGSQNGSRGSNRSKNKDPLRESTMSFFKEAFGKNAAEPKATDGLLAYFMKSRGHEKDDMKNRETGGLDDPFDSKDIETVNGAPMSLLKSRRMTSRK